MKRIVICADGTWNLRDQVDKETKKRRPSNVTKVARAVRAKSSAGIDQVVYYHDGVGTGGPLDKLTGGAFGRGIEDNIRDLYRFVVYNYEAGDDLFLFGFSRGAFTVRTLAGFMHKIELIEKDDDYFVPDLYACYETRKGPGTPEWARAHRHIPSKRPCPRIKFIGVWDTVGALGAPGVLGQLHKKKYAYHDVALNETIENAYHALAIDERRGPFKPTLWQRPPGWTGTLEQAWFPGVHCNVGGGYIDPGLSDHAFMWMAVKAMDVGLRLDERYLAMRVDPNAHGELRNEYHGLYKIMKDYVRPIGKPDMLNEKLHASVCKRMDQPTNAYKPPNLDRAALPPVTDAGLRKIEEIRVKLYGNL